MIGSEGTLGIVTKIVLKLLPHPAHDLLMLVPFSSAEKACAAVSAIFMSGYVPSALEFMERDALEWTMQYVDNSAVPIADDVHAHLLIEVDGNDMDVLMKEMEGIAEVVTGFDCGEILFAEDAQQKEGLWKLRRRSVKKPLGV
jgi:glycolate oxidase